ncbi:NADP-dependent oxidoreductase [Pseudoalteromonas sp. JBTF-M23]|uniref:NADP-dependent oxidoreductase n=1 Tax=Pseudoalteromonas caenipelagi TaxID=2726988 RepID=A0A849VAI9_9GAMM|nr:NADP-dependent oxidoreductase [Pseudoalteromonas caenipelagi]NOU50649.1 NADP-dependent oxidoreductase [Pseudoalteromonas caenipelagi]
MANAKLVFGIEQFGGPENIISKYLVDKKLEQNHVRIKVLASSVNPIDIKTRMGLGFVAAQKQPDSFMGLGYDLYGQIEAVGEQVTSFSVGQYVIGMVGFAHHPGCYAQQVDAHVEQIIALDEKENPTIAGLCLSGLTALQALACLPVLSDVPLFINAPTGGVGHIAVQLAKLQGRHVVALSTRAQHPLLAMMDVKTMNYEHFYQQSYRGQLLDLVGAETALKLIANLGKGSSVVTVPTISKDQVIEFAKHNGIDAQGMVVKANTDDLNKLYQAYRSGKLSIHMDKQFSLNEVAQAHGYMQGAQHCGKIIIVT